MNLRASLLRNHPKAELLCELCAIGVRSRKRDTLAQSSQRTAKHASGFFMLSARYFEHGYSVGAPHRHYELLSTEGRSYSFITMRSIA
jgi:hypothetical protein